MANLNTTYMGIPLKSPLVVASSSLSNMIDRIKRAEASGAGALVILSLFEEQIRLEEKALKAGKHRIDETHLEEARVYFSALDMDAARSHLLWVKKSCEAVDMPLFASLNAATPGTWELYAAELAKTGVAGLELNVYTLGANPNKTGAEIETELYEILERVKKVVDIPVAVKLSPYYTSMANVARNLDERGADGLVLFNRFLQPDIDVDSMAIHNTMDFSTSEEMRLPLRWMALLYGRIKADLALTTGVYTGKDVVKALLAGATAVQVAGALYQHDIEYLSTLNDELRQWMELYDFATVADLRGIVSQQHVEEPSKFERAQYVKLLVGEH